MSAFKEYLERGRIFVRSHSVEQSEAQRIDLPFTSVKVTLSNDGTSGLRFRLEEVLVGEGRQGVENNQVMTLKPTETLSEFYMTDAVTILDSGIPFRLWVFA